MKCQNLFLGKIRKYFNMSAEIFYSADLALRGKLPYLPSNHPTASVFCLLHVYGKCPTFEHFFSILFWPKFCFLCSCFLVGWQTV